MKWAIGCVLLALLVPVVDASDVPSVTLTAVTRIDLHEFVEVPLANMGGGDSALDDGERKCSERTPVEGQLDAAPSYFHAYGDGADSRIVFREEDQDYGCAEARFVVTLPPADADAIMVLSFAADRDIRARAGNIQPNVHQSVRFYAVPEDGNQPTGELEPVPCWEENPYFSPSAVEIDATPLEFTYEFDRCANTQQGRQVVLAFAFGDGIRTGALGDQGMLVAQEFSSRITDVELRFRDMPVAATVAEHDGLDPSRKAVGYTRVDLDVGDHGIGQQEVTIGLHGDRRPLAVYKPGADGLGEPLIDAYRFDSQAGMIQLTLQAETIAQHGTGNYVVLFTTPTTGEIKESFLALAGLVLVAPLVAGVVAQRNFNNYHRSARGRARVARAVMRISLAVSWLAYIGVAAFLLISGNGVGLAAVPLPLPNLISYTVLALAVAVMAAVAVVARRREMQVVLDDLSELEQTQVELERSNSELEQFAYVASHDLKEPLRMVAGYTQLLDMRYGARLDEEGREFLGFASEGARRMQQMVDDMLALSRVRRDPAKVSVVSMDDVMTIVRGHLAGLLKERNVRLQVGAMPPVEGTRSQVVQMMLNLVQNAVKFSPQESPLVEVRGRSEQDRVVITVRDEGIGIAAKQQRRIFDIFQRLHLREEYEGNGIGLAMCKKIVEAHGGTVSVSSKLGAGSTFTIELPMAQAGPLARSRIVRQAMRSPDAISS